MKAKYIKKLRKEIRHYRMYVLSRLDNYDVSEDRLMLHYLIVYGIDPIGAVIRFCKKRPKLYHHIHWIRRSVSDTPDLLLLECGKTYRNRIYLEW